MLELLGAFAALSMAGTLLLSLLPRGSMKSTAAFVIGLMTLLCWAEGIAQLLQLDVTLTLPSSVFTGSSVSLEEAASTAAENLLSAWEAYE